MRSRVAAVLFVLLLPLTACGSRSDEPASPATTAPASPATATSATAAAPTGEPVPEALSGFRCEADGEGRFQASGTLANTSKAKVTFQVTVYVGDVTAGQQRARTRQVPSIAPGGSVNFEVPRIPAPEGGGTCHVQVLTTK